MLTLEKAKYFLWAPFLLSIGVILFFELTFYPKPIHFLCTFAIIAGQVLLAFKIRASRSAIFFSITICIGFAVAEIRTVIAYTEMLDSPQYLQNESGIVRSISTTVNMSSITVENGGSLLKLYSKQKFEELHPGDIVRFSAYIEPPKGAITPYGNEFSKFLYFSNIRATGRIIGKVQVIQETKSKPIFSTIRQKIYAKFKHHLPEIHAEIAAALTIGKKDGIDKSVIETFRKSGTSHLLAISGLHMGLVGLFFFALFRRSCTLSEYLTLRYDIKKISVFAGIASSIFYLQISGNQVSAQRACIMTCTFFLSILADKKVDIFRSIALAAIILIVLYPENIFKPGFQMSFFAVLGICACTSKKDDILFRHTPQKKIFGNPFPESEKQRYLTFLIRKLLITISRFLFYAGRIVKTSIFTTAATTPFVIYHFHYFSLTGIFANAIAIPMTTFLIIPTLIIILALMPIYDSYILYNLLETEIEFLIRLMEAFNRLNFGHMNIQGFSGMTLLIISFGTLILLISKTSKKYFGLVIIGIGSILIKQSRLPDIFISEKNIAIRSSNGYLYFLNVKKIPKNFTARNWNMYLGNYNENILDSDNQEIEIIDQNSYIYRKEGKVIYIDYNHKPNQSQYYDLVITPRATSNNVSDENTLTLENIRQNQNTFIFIDARKIKVVKAKNWSKKVQKLKTPLKLSHEVLPQS